VTQGVAVATVVATTPFLNELRRTRRTALVTSSVVEVPAKAVRLVCHRALVAGAASLPF
jgi:hypothetical protein